MLTDLRFVIRSLIRNRTFTLVTVLTLALGIGAAAAIYSVTENTLFAANRFPDSVYCIGGRNQNGLYLPMRFPFMVDAYEHTSAMSEYGKAEGMSGNVLVKGRPVETSWLGISPSLFPMLGVQPVLGRNFLPSEAVKGADHEVIVSANFWREYLGGSPDALGKKIRLGDDLCTVIGVLKPNLVLPVYFYSDLYRPLVNQTNPAAPWMNAVWILGRLRPGLTPAVARDMLQNAKVNTPVFMRDFLGHERVVLSTLSEVNQQLLHLGVYWMLLAAVGFLYAIACLNVSNLMLVRMLGQRRELSIRLALGGGRWHVARLLLLECLVVATLGALAGALVANWLFPLLLRATGDSIMQLDWNGWVLGTRTLFVLGGLAIVTGLLTALPPMIHVFRTPIHAGLKDGGAALGEGPGIARLRGAFVVLQAAFAVILLSGAGLMVRTFQKLDKVDLGFNPADKVKVQLVFPPSYPTDTVARLNRLREISSVLDHLPGVRAVGFGNDFLLSGIHPSGTKVVGPDGSTLEIGIASLGGGFRDTHGLTLVLGQWPTQRKDDDVLINQTLAEMLFAHVNPIGRFIRPATVGQGTPNSWLGWRVVGVVRDVRATLRDKAGPWVYGPETWGPSYFNTFILRTAGAPTLALEGQIRRALYGYDPQLVVNQVLPITRVIENQLWAERMAGSVLKVLSAIAALLTLVGMFSVLAYTVDRRMGEFGVRLAFGATRGHLVTLVVRRSLILAIVGLGLGLGGALALTRFLQSLIYQTSPEDPLTLLAVGATLLLTAVLAGAIPAYRATKADVASLLRSE